MAFRSDISVAWHLSPRIITVAIPSIEVSIQDLYDTLKELEQQSQNLVYEEIITAAGKEALGGGVFVGLTASLQNAQLAFEARVAGVSEATATATDTGGTVLTDSSATFIADGVERGYVVYNKTSGGKATILSVDSETQVTHLPLRKDEPPVPDDWTIGDAYEIYKMIECNVSGGNLVAVDDVGADIGATLPTWGVQIVRTSSSSATLQELEDIRFSSFQGGVTVNTVAGTSGTIYPTGTLRQPVNNFVDALAIADERGLDRIFLQSDVTLTGLDFSGFRFEGLTQAETDVTVEASATVDNCIFENLRLTGVLDNIAVCDSCRIGTVTGFSGILKDCSLQETITLSGGTVTDIVNCYSGVPGVSTPIIDMNFVSTPLNIRAYTGGLKLINKTQSESISVDFIAGRLYTDTSVITGTIVVRGSGELVEGGSTATFDTTALTNPTLVSDAVWTADETLYTTAGTMGAVVRSDGTTQWRVLQLWVDDPANSRIKGEFALIKDGLMYEAASGSTASLQLYVEGTLSYAVGSITKDPAGLYRVVVNYGNFNTPSGSNIISLVTITDGLDSYEGASGIARVAFTE